MIIQLDISNYYFILIRFVIQFAIMHKKVIKMKLILLDNAERTITGHWCPKQGMQGAEPPAVVSRDIGVPKTNIFC